MTAASGLMVLPTGALLRRRRQKMLGLVAVASIFAAQAGCGPETASSDATETGTLGSSTSTSMSCGDAPDEVSMRMFGKFHDEVDYVGQNASEPPGEMIWYAWSTLQIDRDGSLALSRRLCQGSADVQKFTWVHVGDNVLQVVPNEYKSDGTFEWLLRDVSAVTLTPGQGCDDIQATIEHLPESELPNYSRQYLPGELCAEGQSPGSADDCNFTFVWCEEGAPPACTMDAP